MVDATQGLPRRGSLPHLPERIEPMEDRGFSPEFPGGDLEVDVRQVEPVRPRVTSLGQDRLPMNPRQSEDVAQIAPHVSNGPSAPSTAYAPRTDTSAMHLTQRDHARPSFEVQRQADQRNPLRSRSYVLSPSGHGNPLRSFPQSPTFEAPRVAQSPAPLPPFVPQDRTARIESPSPVVGKGGPVMGKGGPPETKSAPLEIEGPPLIAKGGPGSDETFERSGSAPWGGASDTDEPTRSESSEDEHGAPPRGAENPATPADEQNLTKNSLHSSVEVFYGTDRQRIAAQTHRWHIYVGNYLPTAVVALFSLVVGLLACFATRRALLAGLSLTFLLISVWLAKGATTHTLAFERLAAGSYPVYGTETGGLELGVCRVSIPKNHQLGRLESPSLLRLELREDLTRHVMLMGTTKYDESRFYQKMRERIHQSQRRDMLVFIHGYNTTFENAARRTAQMAYDLEFDGAPVFYSWPSHGGLFRYLADASNVSASVPHLKRFLLDLASKSDADSINLIAHSMGNRAMATALRELAMEMRAHEKLFHEVILAAPDVNAKVFKNDIAPRIITLADRITLYASSNDRALIASKKINGMPRAGESGDGLVVLPGIDTIDVTAIDSSLLGHSYYGSNVSIMADIYHVLKHGRMVHASRWLEPRLHDGRTYWVFQTHSAAVRSRRNLIPR